MSFTIEKDWITPSGLRAIAIVVLREDGSRRHRCGYVSVPEGHPLHGVGYSTPTSKLAAVDLDSVSLGKKSPILTFTACVGAAEGESIRRSPDVVFDVHGGLTFSNGKDYPANGGWWFGFDCAHCDDKEIDEDDFSRRFPREGVVRSLEYVVSECESLASQIEALFPAKEQQS